jgi:putative FmdB family regulatory protein
MPLYEYLCQACGQHFDALRPMKDADQPIACTACRSEQTQRLLSVFNAQSGGRVVGGSGGGCGGCSGGACGSCGHA